MLTPRTRTLVATCAMLVAFLFFSSGPTVAQDAESRFCSVCDVTGELVCALCDGAGRAEQPCAACEGSGETQCTSSRFASLFERLDVKPEKHKGKADCPNPVCRDGKVTWDDGKAYKCKLCGGRGEVACGSCGGGKLAKCGICRGRKVVEDTCPGCDGHGRLPCAACPPRADGLCRLSGDREIELCTTCALESVRSGPCTVCAGRGQQACATCEGLAKVACEDCAATGRYRARYEDDTTAASHSCGRCDKKGYRDCSDCGKGNTTCRACKGDKVEARDCPSCFGAGERACRLCTSASWRTLENTAAAQIAKEDDDGAIESLRAALVQLEQEREAVQQAQARAAGDALKRIRERREKEKEDDGAAGAEADAEAALDRAAAAAADLAMAGVMQRVYERDLELLDAARERIEKQAAEVAKRIAGRPGSD